MTFFEMLLAILYGFAAIMMGQSALDDLQNGKKLAWCLYTLASAMLITAEIIMICEFTNFSA